MDQSVQVPSITSALRFAAADRQWLLERKMGRGDADATDMLEAQALRAARYAESFDECYSADLVAASRELLGQFGMVGAVTFDVFASDDYYQHCQMVLGLAGVL